MESIFAYAVKGNKLGEGILGLEADSLEQLVMQAAKAGGGLFNNVGQHYNHSFFWNSINANGGGQSNMCLSPMLSTRDSVAIELLRPLFVGGGNGSVR